MKQALTLPTRKDEAYRYADLAALETLWPLPVQDIRVAAGEQGALAVVLDGANDAARDIAITLEDGAEFDLRLLHAGSAYRRIAVSVSLGKGAKFHLGAAQIAGGDQTVEIVTEVTHAEPDAVSSQVVRSVLGGKSTGTYLGKVVVARGAIGTDGSQSIRAMLLDRTATANARPELEIYADDVKCAHGCAVGELDPQGLFYLAQRGLPPALAKKLMLQAFIAEAFVGAADEEALTDAALKALEAVL
ncbi:SufD family Fe-S cluster assembly protein [Novosphingobium sp. ERN07]|uniref:SufD family Fe-S cluster assembly protein n=1 Tax=Novosphingobium sp. ERN07 TaxID=2726187 RepID=UPI0014567FAC|nr:SufD family Fe-S cluster assembly protein [Novosphingobium sp. ERN07]NLR69751.1 SufD family Fe-S cluster assembly protein [Novosphingobium sp. ERN07]